MAGEEREVSVSVCQEGKTCLHLNGGSIFQVLAERDYWRETAEKRKGAIFLAEKEILRLREENHQVKEEKQSLQQELNHAVQRPLKRFFERKKREQPDRKRGAPVGHPGRGRQRPVRIDRYIDIWPSQCDHCGRQNITVYPQSFQDRIVQDIEVKVVNTCYRSHYGYCATCQKIIYPQEANNIIPKSRIGLKARAVSGYLRYIGIPYRKVAKIFRNIFGLEITHPTLQDFDTKMAKNGEPIYEQIKNAVRLSSLIHADETGWPQNGANWQLWGFINKEIALYRIEKSRGAQIVKDTLGEKYNGFLISDFYSSYNSIEAKGKQKCLYHLLEETKKIAEENKFSEGSQESLFGQDLKSTLNDAIDAWNRFHAGEKADEDLKELKGFKDIIAQRITDILLYPSENEDIQRLKKRIIKHNNELFTFLVNIQ